MKYEGTDHINLGSVGRFKFLVNLFRQLLNMITYLCYFVVKYQFFLIIGHNQAGPRLNIKTVLSTYGDFHVKDKTAVRTSYL